MTIEEFENRAKYQGGYDRELDGWRIIDVHQIPDLFDKNCEIDFYCSNNRTVYLLRLRYRETEFFELNSRGGLPYLIAEFPIQEIDDKILKAILDKFNLK